MRDNLYLKVELVKEGCAAPSPEDPNPIPYQGNPLRFRIPMFKIKGDGEDFLHAAFVEAEEEVRRMLLREQMYQMAQPYTK